MTFPLRHNPAACAFARRHYEQGDLLRIIVERLAEEHGISVTTAAIRWRAQQEQWNQSRRPFSPQYVSRRAVQEIETDLDRDARRCLMRCEYCQGRIAPNVGHHCGGIVDPRSGVEHRCGRAG